MFRQAASARHSLSTSCHLRHCAQRQTACSQKAMHETGLQTHGWPQPHAEEDSQLIARSTQRCSHQHHQEHATCHGVKGGTSHSSYPSLALQNGIGKHLNQVQTPLTEMGKSFVRLHCICNTPDWLYFASQTCCAVDLRRCHVATRQDSELGMVGAHKGDIHLQQFLSLT